MNSSLFVRPSLLQRNARSAKGSRPTAAGRRAVRNSHSLTTASTPVGERAQHTHRASAAVVPAPPSCQRRRRAGPPSVVIHERRWTSPLFDRSSNGRSRWVDRQSDLARSKVSSEITEETLLYPELPLFLKRLIGQRYSSCL